MENLSPALKRPPREQEAWDEIGHTAISRSTTFALVVGSLLMLVAIPAIQLWLPMPGAESPFARIDPPSESLLAAMQSFESEDERQSWLQRTALPWSQLLLARWGGVGNEKVYVGQGGWLFLRPGVDLLTGPGFLEPTVLERRQLAASSWRELPQADPLPALLDFHRQLEARGVELVVMPIPPKAALVPRRLARRAADPAEVPLHNPSFGDLRARLEGAGMRVFDPTAALLRTRAETGREPFLRTDSHWSPEGMDTVARELAGRLELLGIGHGAASTERLELREEKLEIHAEGDLARMLELPAGQRLYPEEETTIARVSTLTGEPWRADPAAAVLLLGDSFVNVFSRADLGWGESAGLAERLSFHLGLPVDRLAVNDGGDFEARQRLAQELAAGDDRLAGKRVVVYTFAARELAIGDWRLVSLPEAREPRPEAPAAKAGVVKIRARIAAVAPTPAPGSTPYREVLVAIHLVEVETIEGTAAGALPAEILAYGRGLRDGRSAPAAAYRPGQQVELRLVPLEAAPPEVESLQRVELPGDDLLFLDAFWVEDDAP